MENPRTRIHAAYFLMIGVMLVLLTMLWIGGFYYTIVNFDEVPVAIQKGLGWSLALSGLTLLAIWITWFTVGFRAMGVKVDLQQLKIEDP